MNLKVEAIQLKQHQHSRSIWRPSLLLKVFQPELIIKHHKIQRLIKVLTLFSYGRCLNWQQRLRLHLFYRKRYQHVLQFGMPKSEFMENNFP